MKSGRESPQRPASDPPLTDGQSTTTHQFLLDEQARRWAAGERARVEAYLADAPELVNNPAAVLDLIYQEFLLRLRSGEAPSTDEYLARFPDLASDLKVLFSIDQALASEQVTGTYLPRRPHRAENQFPFLAPAQTEDELGRLGPYRILSVLGRGGMGVVFQAEDTVLRRKVALKVILPQLMSEPSAKSRFLREARTQAAVEHDHVTAIYQVGEANGVTFIAMPLLKGQSLADCVKAVPLLPIQESIRIGREMAEGLSAAHQVGLVHRDVKPANVFLEGHLRRVKLLDFGLACQSTTDLAESSRYTEPGAILGTPAYMSPEQARGTPADARSDLFSLGCVLYELLTGRSPFRAPNIPATLLAITTNHPSRPAADNRNIPPRLDVLVMQLLAKDPADRPATAEQVADELRHLESAHITSSTVITSKRSRALYRRRLIAVVGGLCLLTVILMVTWPRILQFGVAPKPATGSTGQVQPGASSPHAIADGSQFDHLDRGQIPESETFDWQPKELVAVIGSHARRVWGAIGAIAISPDGTRVAAGVGDGLVVPVMVWEMATGKLLATIPHGGLACGVRSLAFAPDGQRLLVGRDGNGAGIQMWRLSGERPELVGLVSHEGAISEFFDMGQSAVVVGRPDDAGITTIHLVDVSGDQPQVSSTKLNCRTRPVFATERDRLIYVSTEGKLRRINVRGGKFEDDQAIDIPVEQGEWPRAVTPDGRRLALWAGDQLQIWDLSGDIPTVVHHLKEFVESDPDVQYAISPDGKWFTSTYVDTALFRLAGISPKMVGWLDQTARSNGRAVFSRDGARLIVGNSEGFVRGWDMTGGEPVEVHPFDPDTATPTPSGLGWRQSAAFDGRKGRILLPRYDSPNGQQRYQFWDFSSATAQRLPRSGRFLDASSLGPACFVGSDRYLALTAEDERSPRLYQYENDRWKEAGSPFGPAGASGNVSPDGNLLIVYNCPTGGTNQLEGWNLTAMPPTQDWSILLTGYPPLGTGDRHVWFSGDGRSFATQARGSTQGMPWRLVLWKNAEAVPKVMATLPVSNDPTRYRAALSADGQLLVHTPESGLELCVEELVGGSPQTQQRISLGDNGRRWGWVFTLDFHPDQRWLAVGTALGVGVLDLATGEPLWQWNTAPGAVVWLKWASDGRHLICHNENKTVYVLRLPVKP